MVGGTEKNQPKKPAQRRTGQINPACINDPGARQKGKRRKEQGVLQRRKEQRKRGKEHETI
eukprot:3889580-Amphidinium_carterae.1